MFSSYQKDLNRPGLSSHARTTGNISNEKKKKKTIERRLSGSVYTVKDTQIICYWRTSGLIVRHVTLGNNAHKTLGKPTPCVHYWY